MIDYREEYYYRIFVLLFIISNFQTNRLGRKILTIKKLEIMYFLIQNPLVMDSVLRGNKIGKLQGYSGSLYDDSMRRSDFEEMNIIGLTIPHLQSEGIVHLDKKDEGIFVTCDPNLANEINDGISNLLSLNLEKIRKLASLTESKLQKSLMGL